MFLVQIVLCKMPRIEQTIKSDIFKNIKQLVNAFKTIGAQTIHDEAEALQI
jgi:hypothetical protein